MNIEQNLEDTFREGRAQVRTLDNAQSVRGLQSIAELYMGQFKLDYALVDLCVDGGQTYHFAFFGRSAEFSEIPNLNPTFLAVLLENHLSEITGKEIHLADSLEINNPEAGKVKVSAKTGAKIVKTLEDLCGITHGLSLLVPQEAELAVASGERAK